MTEPQPTPPRRGISRLGLAALVTVLAGFVLPLVVFGIGWAITQGTADSVGGYAVGIGFAIAAGAAIAFPFSLVGIVLAIIALTRRNRGRALAVTALVLGFVPLVAAAILFTQIGRIVGS
ncbi:MAG: hypothetical protein ACOH19_01095 [Rhodoglobus sp.]